jgi:PST family polysaccharide transporter
MTVSQPAVNAICVWVSTGWIPGRPHSNVGIRSMLKFGGTITLNGLVVYVGYNFEKLLLGRFWGAAALGLYGRAYQLIKLPTDLLNYSLGSVAFPALSRVQGDPKLFRSYFLKGYSLVLTMTVPLTIMCALFANEIVAVFLGPKWTEAAVMFRLLAPTVLVFAAINPLGWLLYAAGLVGRSLRLALVIAPLVITAVALGVSHGPNGVAFAYSTAMVLWLIPHMAWCVHGTSISFRDLLNALLRPVAAGVVAALFGYAVQAAFGQTGPVFVKLVLESAVLVAVYLWVLLMVLGQKPLIVNVVQELVGRSQPVAVANAEQA